MGNNNILNRVFSKNAFIDLVDNKKSILYSTTIKRYLDDTEYEKNGDAISAIYDVLLKVYRNEYVYKNILLNKILLGRHSLRTTTALTEVPIGKSKADFILINGSATVYEIKTELDSLERLQTQLEDYYKAFTQVCVITCDAYYERVSNLLGESNVGICVLTKRNTISEKKKVIRDNQFLSHEIMFKILRKKEYEEVILKHYGYLPIAKPVKYYGECLKLFKTINVDLVNKYMLSVLKNRNRVYIEDFENKVPKELSSLVYFSGFKASEYTALEDFLNNDYRGL